MNHLSHQEIQMLADEALDSQERDRVLSHTNTCAACARDVAFQQSLVRTIRQAPLEKPSRGFSARVMERVAPGTKGGLALRVLGSFGSVIAMVIVLGVIGYVMTFNLPSTLAAAEGREQSELMKMFSESYASMKQFFALQSNEMTQTVSEQTTAKGAKVGLMALASLVILALVDRIVFKQLRKMRL